MRAGDDQGDTALQASERRLSLAQRALGFGIWDWDLVGRTIEWSPEMYAILGLDPVADAREPYAGWLRVLHPDDREREDRLAQESASKGTGFSRTFRIVRAGSGEVRWIRTDATVVCDEAGRAVRMVGVNLDVTDQQRAAEALRESQAELRLITDSLPELISFIDRSGIYRFANQAYQDWYGQSPSEVVGRHVRAVLGEAAYEIRRPFIERALAGQDCSLDVEITRADGRIRFGEARYLAHRDDSGAVDGFYAYVIDITERKRQEAALQATSDRLRLATEGTGLGTYDLDLATGEGTWSEAAFRMLGLEPTPDGQATLSQWRARIHPDDRDRLEAQHADMAARGGSWQSEYRIVRADTGATRWLRIYGQFVIQPPRGTLRSTGVVMDITERKLDEESLAESEARLRLHVDALKQAQSKLAETAAALNALVANAPIGFAFFDREHRYTRVNGVLAEINGLSVDAHLGRTIEELLPVNAQVVAPVLERVFATGEAVSGLEVDGETPAQPGRRRSWLAGFFPVQGPDGGVAEVGATVVEITDRKRAEAEIRASEARFRGVFESGAVGFSIFDANSGETLAINDYLLSLTGHSRADFDEGRWDWRDFTPPDQLHLDAAAVHQARQRGFWAPFEKEFIRKDGRRVPVRLSSAPLPGEPGCVVCVISDLTEVRAAEARIRENEERLRLATENAEVGFWDVDEVNQVLHWPPQVKALFGISPDVAVTMRDFYEGLHPEDRAVTAAAYAAAADPARRALYDVEYRTIGKEDGVVRWIAAKGRGVFDPQGVCLRVAGTAVEITGRKVAEERLRELNETLERRVETALAERKLLADIVEGTDALVQVADPEFRWLAINRAAANEFETIFGVRPRVGQSMLDAIAHLPEHQAAVRAVWSRALAGEQFTEISVFGDPSRARRFYEMKYNTLRDADGRLVGAYQFVYDVTQRMLEQERLRKTEDALRQAQKMEAVGQLTGGIAHDFNNLLQGVAGSLDLIRRKPGDRERVQRWAEAGFKAAERGARLTGQLLAFSRAQKMELKPVVLSDLVAGFRDMLARTIGAHIQVNLDLAAERLVVLGDEVQIEMAVLNLALNGRDAMPDGGEVTIGTRVVRLQRDPELADGDYVELSVSDTGTGMPPEVVARAFDPFFTTKGVGKGTGLGLSQVYGAVRQAGGSVRIESRMGEGTTVRLFLVPTGCGEVEDAPPPDGRDHASVSAHILLIDDDPDVRRFLTELLDEMGLTVTAAESGIAGLHRLAEVRPDAVILDFAMPGLNGAEVAKRIRQSHPDLPIIFVTGFAESAALDAASTPDTPVLRKPFGVSELQSVLFRALAVDSRARPQR